MSETDLVRQTIEALSQYERRLFRNNVGRAIQGKWRKHMGGQVMVPAGSIIVEHPRIIDFGLATGSGDLIGVRSVEITPEMVGTRIGQFVSLEGKLEGRSHSTEQDNWHKQITFMGGLSGTFRTVEEAAQLLGARKK
jgi:hypothetical protein